MSRRSGRPRRVRGSTTLDGYQAPRISTRPAEPEEDPEPVKRIPLFYIDGREYSVPVELPPAIGLRYLRNVREASVDSAVAELLAEALGEDAFDALTECDRMKRKQMQDIVDLVMGIALGSVDPGKD